METFEIVRMERCHLAAVWEIEKVCFSMPWSYDSLAGELKNPLAVFYVALAGGAVAGYAGMIAVEDEGYIANIAVAPSFRRMGVASALMEEFDRFAEKRGLSFLSLEVRASNNAAIALYSSRGFMFAGRRRNFYENPTEDGFIMTKAFKSGSRVN